MLCMFCMFGYSLELLMFPGNLLLLVVASLFGMLALLPCIIFVPLKASGLISSSSFLFLKYVSFSLHFYLTFHSCCCECLELFDVKMP